MGSATAGRVQRFIRNVERFIVFVLAHYCPHYSPPLSLKCLYRCCRALDSQAVLPRFNTVLCILSLDDSTTIKRGEPNIPLICLSNYRSKNPWSPFPCSLLITLKPPNFRAHNSSQYPRIVPDVQPTAFLGLLKYHIPNLFMSRGESVIPGSPSSIHRNTTFISNTKHAFLLAPPPPPRFKRKAPVQPPLHLRVALVPIPPLILLVNSLQPGVLCPHENRS
ncbi:hypothetical protein BS47DRAFT_739918 [Hydnum rufescens UP504]|uniref:Uncharacterized protein n=1 Tax=Hydnum rufescens UP504 TaxID=1448309 RepID=A0A9P6B2C6_9AGAM|nr:hypothetical protein BS47DRAFT_739918 [Hydnum rufescens UP504]